MSLALQPLSHIVEAFSLFDDWEERYRYLIDLGKKLPIFPEEYRIRDHEVPGCTSKVWMVPEIRNGVFHFQADSNSDIVKGLVAILMAMYQDLPVTEISAIDPKEIFTELGLEQNLMPNRRNGFYAMVEKIKAFSQVS